MCLQTTLKFWLLKTQELNCPRWICPSIQLSTKYKVGFPIVCYKTILRVSWFSSWFSAKWSMSFVISPCKKSALSVPATRITERLARWHFLKNVFVAKFRELTTWRPTLFSNMMIWQVFLQQILLQFEIRGIFCLLQFYNLSKYCSRIERVVYIDVNIRWKKNSFRQVNV